MTQVLRARIHYGCWLIDAPGSGLLRQSATVWCAGRATSIVEDVCRYLAEDVMSLGLDYGTTIVPYGLDYQVDPRGVVATHELAILVRPGVASSVEHQQAGSGIDRSVVQLDLLMRPPSEARQQVAYERMHDVEVAVEAMLGRIGIPGSG